ncbi:MAG: hypothetical protein ABFD46_03610 [Armatimonadota bacterium]
MRRCLLSTIALTLIIFLVTSIAPTLIDISGSTAYAQGPFGKKSAGSTNKVEEPKKDQDNEEQEKKEEKKDQSDKKKDSTASANENNKSESKKNVKTDERDTKDSNDSNSSWSTTTSNTSKSSSDSRKTPDARPTQKSTTAKDTDHKNKDSAKDKVYKRTDERPEESHKKIHHSHQDCYPYDPDWVVVYPRPSYPDSYPTTTDSTEKLTTQQLVDDISYAWLNNTPELICNYLPAKKEIKIYKDKKLLCKMKAEDYYAATVDAMNDWQTVDYILNVVDYRWNKIVARGHHIYKDKGDDSNSVVHRSDVYCILRLEKKKWVITDMGFTSVVDIKESGREYVDK